MNKKDVVICFDLDDTLIDDSYKFELTFCDCIKVILESFETRPPQIDEVLQLARQLDNQNLEAWPSEKKYTPTRLKSTWLETYITLCDLHKVPQKHHTKILLDGLVRKNYDPPYFIIPGAIEALTSLERLGYELHLITVGTEEIQRKKVEVTGLGKFFKTIQISKDANKGVLLANLAAQYGKDKLIMVGNSLRTDVNPALELGIKVIYIPRGSWHQFNAEPINRNYIAIPDIADLMGVIETL